MSTLEAIFGTLAEPDATVNLTDYGIERLSFSSMDDLRCPEKFRRERILKEPRVSSPHLMLGSAFHKTIEHTMRLKIESHEDLPLDLMADVAADSWNTVLEDTKGSQEIHWNNSDPASVQSELVGLVGAYMTTFAPAVQPVAVERWIETTVPGLGVPLVGKIDVETADGRIIDYKTKSSSPSQISIDKSSQATGYLWARREEGNPASAFMWHAAVRNKVPVVKELRTERTEGQMQTFPRAVLMAARVIQLFYDTFGPDEPWPGAHDGDNLCSPIYCGLWPTCVWRGGAK